MYQHLIEQNNFLQKNIPAFYHTDYVRYGNPGNPDYINTLKNTYGNCNTHKLARATGSLKSVLLNDLPTILRKYQLIPLTVCVVPRAKVNYNNQQLLFKNTVQEVVNELNGFIDGTNYIKRHTDTRTTHFRRPIPNYNNNGSNPYLGITEETCHISNQVSGKNILLIDDIYTKTVNIDEDAIQALLNKGAKSVIFYSVAKTTYNNN